MRGIDFTFALAAGALLLASWVDARVGDGRPESPMKRIGLCLVGVLVLHEAVTPGEFHDMLAQLPSGYA